MKKKLLFVLLFAGFLMLPGLTRADTISNFNSAIKINADSSIAVTETIVYDFGQTQHHGIDRYIPYSYQARGGNYNLAINVTSVANENNQAYPY